MKGERMNKKFTLLVFALSLIVSIPLCLHGQTTGKIEGVVADAETGEPLVGAQITIEGTLLGNISNEDGYYFILNVPAGLRNVVAQLIGYQSVTVADQRVLAGQTHTVDFGLNSTVIELPGQVVEGERAPLVPRDNTVSKHRVTFETAQALPADNFRDIVTLQAGVVRFGDAGNSQFQISVRGGRTSENAVYIDGINIKRYQTDQNLLDVPEYGIEEIDVITGSAGSEFGDAQSGVINIVTREGGQNLSGQFRIETDEFNPTSANYGYNRGQFSLGGPIPVADNLTFYFSSEVVGKGDRRPRAAGFKGTTDDLFDVAERYSNADQVRQELGYDLDLVELMRTAQRENPSMPILNLAKYREGRFGRSAFEGRLPGHRGDEFRIQGKVAFQPTRNVKLIGSYLEDRGQGLFFSRARIFWTAERNPAFVNKNQLGIFGYDHTLSQSAERNTNISLRTSFQRFATHRGGLANPDKGSPPYFAATGYNGQNLGYGTNTSWLNFMFNEIPTFQQNMFVTRWSQIEEFGLVVKEGNTDQDPERRDNPFGTPVLHWDQNEGFEPFLYNSEEDRFDARFDFDSQLNRVHRLRAGTEVKVWQLDTYLAQDVANNTFLDYSRVKPDMESFYIEDRMDYRDLVIDLGLRLDSFYAGTTYPMIFGDQDPLKPRLDPSRKTEVAPRLGVAHPVTERTQVRVSYGTKLQVPEFRNLYNNLNTNVDWSAPDTLDPNYWPRQENTNAFFGNPDLGFRKTTAFEVGFTTLLSENWVLDVVGYNRDIDGNVAARYLRQEGGAGLRRIFVNMDHGNVRGMDTTVRKRFSNYFSADFTYTLLFSQSTGTDPEDFVRNEGRPIGGGDPPLPPVQPSPNDFDQTHTFNTQFNIQFPSDFREGTHLGSALKNLGAYVTFQANSGRPFTRQDEGTLDYLENINQSRRGWQSLANLRVTKDFSWGGLDYTAFADIRNLFDTDNLSAYQVDVFSRSGVSNGVYQTTGSPYSDGETIDLAIQNSGAVSSNPDAIPGGNNWITDIDGDGEVTEADKLEIINRMDFDGDGVVTEDEELAIYLLQQGAYDANPYSFDIPRLFRLGFEVKF
jgi:outer membrane receptor protein involved in Fe transport